MPDMVNHPPHYTNLPDGIFAECIDYARHMPYAQGAAFKYLYRAGAKANTMQDLAKAAWYLRDAIDHSQYINARLIPGVPRIDPNTTHRAKALHYIARGELATALAAIDHFGIRILDPRGI